MSSNYSGRARTEIDITDLSVLIATGLKGVNAVLGKTERGKVGTPITVGSWNEYKKHFGGLLPDSDFPLYCKRALESGAKIMVSRVAHFTTITDKTTLVGTVAVGDGATSTANFKADNIGTWGNGLKVTIANAANGATNQVDITVQLAGNSELDYTIKNINKTLTASDIATFNMQSLLVKLDDANVGLVLAPEVVTFTGGAETRSDIVLNDYIGDSTAGNGIHSFDNETEFTKIAIPEMAIPELDIALTAYVETRKDCLAVLRTPIGISGLVAIDYRNGTGSFSHTPINNWRALMFYGSVVVTDPLTGGSKSISVIGDVLGAMSRRDNKDYEWFTFAGSKRGLISNVISFDYNLASPARATEFDKVDTMGLNAVVADRDFGAVIWGNNSLTKNNTLLKHANIAELLVFMSRGVSPLVRSELFEPNDIATWKAIHRKVRPFMQRLKDKRAIWDFLYQGDQTIDDISQAVVNDPQNIDNGEYYFTLWIKPKAGLKYIGIRVVVTNSGVNFEEVAGQPTF